MHSQLTFLEEIFSKNSYPGNFINRCFKLFLNRIHIHKEKAATVKKRPLGLFLRFLGTISLQTKTKLQDSIKGVPNYCKLQVIFKS